MTFHGEQPAPLPSVCCGVLSPVAEVLTDDDECRTVQVGPCAKCGKSGGQWSTNKTIGRERRNEEP